MARHPDEVIPGIPLARALARIFVNARKAPATVLRSDAGGLLPPELGQRLGPSVVVLPYAPAFASAEEWAVWAMATPTTPPA